MNTCITIETIEGYTKEIVELSSIAKSIDLEFWNAYLKNSSSGWENNFSEKITPEIIKNEVCRFWNHDWLLTPGCYFIKLLTYTVIELQEIIKKSGVDYDLLNIISNYTLQKDITVEEVELKLKNLRESAKSRLEK